MVMSHLVSVRNQNPSPLEEQPGLITTELSPVPFSKIFFLSSTKNEGVSQVLGGFGFL